MANIFYDKDADLSVLQNKKIGIIGYGNQGRAQALNLNSGDFAWEWKLEQEKKLPEFNRLRKQAFESDISKLEEKLINPPT